jgi:aryl-alcohol dehydrogenase-like predicted oxidoreductase
MARWRDVVTVNPGPCKSGPLVSGPLIFGGAPIGGLYAPVSDKAAAGTVAAAWEAGIRAFDTAPHYGVGVSERRLGSFLAGRPRDEFTVCTKVGRRLVPATGDVQGEEGFYDIPPLTRVRDYSRDGVRRSLEESLERLGLDRVDIVLVHDSDDFMEQAADEAYPALAELRAQGTVRAVGAGMNSATALAWLVERCDLDCVLVAGRYTLLDDSAAASLFPLCQRRGVAVLAGGVFNSGILADPCDGARYDYAPAPPALLARARRLRDACARYGVPLAAAALRFTLRHPAVTAALVGARSAKEITANTSHLSTPVPDALWAELDASLLWMRIPRPEFRRQAGRSRRPYTSHYRSRECRWPSASPPPSTGCPPCRPMRFRSGHRRHMEPAGWPPRRLCPAGRR